MPLVIVEAIEGRTIEQKRGLIRGITDAVVEHFKVTPEAVQVVIHDLPKTNVAKAGKLSSDS